MEAIKSCETLAKPYPFFISLHEGLQHRLRHGFAKPRNFVFFASKIITGGYAG